MIKPSIEDIQAADDLFAKMRGGNAQPLEIGLDASCMFPVRLLSAREEAQIAARARQKALTENPYGLEEKIIVALETMIATLREATSIKGQVGLSQMYLERLPSADLSALFDQFTTLNKVINPDFHTMKPEEIEALVEGVRQKKTLAKDFFTWQLAAVGKYFLEAIQRAQPTDNVVGSH